MRKIGIFVNIHKDYKLEVTSNIIAQIESIGAYAEIADAKNFYDLIISIGGDGTFLSAARNFFNKDIPIVGLNLGTLGYLSVIEKSQIKEALNHIINEKYEIEERILLKGISNNQVLYALNDIVISRGSYEKMINIKASLDNRYIDDYHCDGIIVATPTGSTAYSLSAGGPIVEPNIDVLLITPVCSHSLYQRPIIISSDRNINISSVDKHSFMVASDGQESIENVNDIIIKKAEKKIKIIKLKDEFFFNTLRNKLIKKL